MGKNKPATSMKPAEEINFKSRRAQEEFKKVKKSKKKLEQMDLRQKNKAKLY